MPVLLIDSIIVIFIVVGTVGSASGWGHVVVDRVGRRGALDGISDSSSQGYFRLGEFFQHELWMGAHT